MIVIGWSIFGEARVDQRIIWFATGAVSLFLIWLLKYLLKLDWLNPVLIYAVVFWVFHFGLLFPASISPEVLSTLAPWARTWIDQPETRLALVAAVLFLTSYMLGILSAYRQKPFLLDTPIEDGNAPGLIAVGWMLIGLSILMVLIAIVDLGWRILLRSYSDFYVVHNSFSWPIVIMATGIMLQIAGGRDTSAILKTLGFLFVPLIIPVTIAGARTAPLFSSIAIVSVSTLRGFRIPLRILVPGVLLLLLLIATVKDVRQQGVEAIVSQSRQIEVQDPLAGLAELGGSLRPVSASIDFIRGRGALFYGETYVFPLTRQLERFSGTRGTVLTDERFIAATINRLYGSIGYSTVAEAYVNFGAIGVALFAFVWGVCLGWLTSHAKTPYRIAVLAVILIPMLINVRNSFIYVPAWVFFGLMAIALARAIRMARNTSAAFARDVEPENVLTRHHK